MSLSTIEKQIDRIEQKINAQRGGTVSLWLAGLLKSPEENEVILNAASFLIQEGILDAPEDHLWQRLTQRWDGDVTQWPDIRLWFIGAKMELDSANFDDDAGKEALVYLARIYFEVFHHEAPKQEDKQQQVWRESAFNEKFLRPMLSRACPALSKYSHATFTTWLQKRLDAPEAEEAENDLALLREYVATFHKEV